MFRVRAMPRFVAPQILRPLARLTAGLVLVVAPMLAALQWGRQVEAPAIAGGLHGLNMFALWACIVATVIVCTAMIYSVATVRRQPDAPPATFRYSRAAEVLWALVPVLIVVGLAVPAVAPLLFD